MFNAIIIFITILALYTKIVWIEFILYLAIFFFFYIWTSTLHMEENKLNEIFKKISPSEMINNNMSSIQIVGVAIPLFIGQWWILSSLWIVGSIIQHRALYNYINRNNKNDNKTK
jgi:hypothetical protein